MSQKKALVTGGGKGIGRGIALALAKAGYDVAVHYGSSRDGAEEMAQQIRQLGREAITLQADLKDVAAIRSLFAEYRRQFDRIDVLVNNAGITRLVPFLEVEEDVWEEVMQTDLRGSFFCAQEAARLMVATESKGVIIQISSNHSEGCWPNATVYGPAKAAVSKLVRNMALDLAPHGIRVVGIAPGYTRLEWIPESANERIAQTARKIPLQRFAQPAEIGDAAVFLASESGGYITGTTLFMDGGALLPVVPDNHYS